MGFQPLVSIIVPAYNCARYIQECIVSVLRQSYQNFEILVIDDGSTDGTYEECECFRENDRRIRVYHIENHGVAYARNYGIEHSTGEYVAFLDADDWWDSDFLEKTMSGLKNTDYAICHLVKVSSDGKHTSCEKIVLTTSPTSNIIACWRGLYIRSVLDNWNIRFTFGLRTGEDQEFVYKYLLHCEKISYVPEAIYYYRMNPSSCMFKKTYAHFDAVEALKNAVDYARHYGTAEQAAIYERDLIRYNAVRTIEFATLTLLTAGESWRLVYNYIKEHSYDELIAEAMATGDYYHSRFYDLWRKSPALCLRFFAVKKFLGRAFHRFQLWK